MARQFGDGARLVFSTDLAAVLIAVLMVNKLARDHRRDIDNISRSVQR